MGSGNGYVHGFSSLERSTPLGQDMLLLLLTANFIDRESVLCSNKLLIIKSFLLNPVLLSSLGVSNFITIIRGRKRWNHRVRARLLYLLYQTVHIHLPCQVFLNSKYCFRLNIFCCQGKCRFESKQALKQIVQKNLRPPSFLGKFQLWQK